MRALASAGRLAGLFVAALLLMGIGPREQASKTGAASGDALAGYRKEMLVYFRSHYLLPIVIPEGQSVGDVYSSDFWTLEERANNCFPALPPGRSEATDLPILQPSAASSAGFAVGVTDVAKSGFAGKAVVLFTNVSVTTTSKGDLRRSLSKDCAYLTPILEEQVVGKGVPVKIVLGRVVYAKKAAFFGFDGAGAEQQAKALAQRLSSVASDRLGSVRVLDAGASAVFDPGAKAGVLAETRAALPIAFAPAFLPKTVVDGFGFNEGTRGAGGPPQFKWDQFDPAAKTDDRRLFEALVDALGK